MVCITFVYTYMCDITPQQEDWEKTRRHFMVIRTMK